MKLDTRALRYLTSDDWRVLAAVEQGSKNHEVVPTPLIQSIAGLRNGSGVHRCISSLAKDGLIAKVKNAKYDGYRLTYGGLDYLALNTHRRGDVIFSLGNQIGIGKESDIYITASPAGRQQVLKLHRLGRISFRSVKSNRDYLRNRSTGSWMYLSRLSAQKEFAFMKILHREGFAVPEPISWSRHTVVMEFIDSFPLRSVDSVAEPGKLYAELMDLIVALASRGLIHGDFNEFNILIKEETKGDKVVVRPILIDFPQVVSTNHVNAEMYFDRDVNCIKRYFQKRFRYVSDEPGPFFKDAMERLQPELRLDVEVEASGFSKKMAKELSRYVEATADADDLAADSKALEDEDSFEDELTADEDGGEEEGGEGGEEEAADDMSNDERTLASEVHALDLDAPSITDTPHSGNFGLLPLELSTDPSATTQKARTMKRAAGWAI